jgi:trimeric autotransporter adhesin
VIATGKTFLLAAGVTMLGGSLAYGAQPPDVVASDSVNNTAMGTNVLAHYDTNHGESGNTGAGFNALANVIIGAENTAFGTSALVGDYGTFGSTAVGSHALMPDGNGGNTAVGNHALSSVSYPGNDNTAIGSVSLGSNTTGVYNTAAGAASLYSNTTGNYNCAVGYQALFSNTASNDNAALGYQALHANRGSANAASGMKALFANTSGIDNSAMGSYALQNNTSGNFNTALGNVASQSNTTGAANTAVGRSALIRNTTGSNNIALGANAGDNLTGSNNIDIGNQGYAGETGTIRIGAPSTQSAVFISGISSARVTGSPVFVSANGQLGVLASAARYKTSIESLGEMTKLNALRPVSFHLKNDPEGNVQYGLIAEEVAKIFPDLAIRDAAGRIQGVRYDEMAPLLLRRIQRQEARIAANEAALEDIRQHIAQLNESTRKLRSAAADVQARGATLASRGTR